jgi:signal transduction histidine kinase
MSTMCGCTCTSARIARRGLRLPGQARRQMLRTLLRTAQDVALPWPLRRACLDQATPLLAQLRALAGRPQTRPLSPAAEQAATLTLPPSRPAAVTNNDPAPLDRGTADEDLEALVQRLRLEVQERDDLLAMAAHELHNPLHALTLQLALARTLAQSSQQSETALRIAKAQATLARYADRVTVLLDLVKTNADAYPLDLRPVDLGALVRSVAETLAPEAQFRGVAIEVVAPARCDGVTDALVLEQVLDNLLLNAFKHAACSTVRLELRCLPDGRADLVVADDGRGIAVEDQQRIFAKFGVAKRTERGSGTGLGLWIVRKLVQVLGGSIALRSAPQAGCEFTLRIPMSQRSEQAP